MSINGIGSAYFRALDGINAAQKGISVISNNIANVNTPGYTRQQLMVGTRQSGGVFVSGVSGFINPFVERQLVDERSSLGMADSRRLTMSFMEDLVSESGGAAIGTSLTNFFNSWSELAADPANSALRQNVRETGEGLASSFSSINSQLQGLRSNLSGNIGSSIDSVNMALREVAQLNEQIQGTSDQGSLLDLQNARNVALQNISSQIGINYFETDQGLVNVQIAGTGFPLVNGTKASTLSGSNDLSAGGVYSVSATIPGSTGGTGVDVTDGITNGSLGGYLHDRNTTLNERIAQIDSLAYEVALQLNTQHQNGYGLDGVTGRNFFAPLAGVEGAAANFSLDNAILNDVDAIAAAGDDPAVSGVGDSSNINLIVDLQNQKFLDGNSQSFNEFISSFRSSIGIDAAQVNADFESQSDLVNRLQVQRENISGVNLDEEALELVRYQRAFEGSARILAASNEIFDTLLQL